MGRNGYKDLVVWRNAKDLAVLVSQLAENGSLGRDIWLRDQICRSAVSIARNIAEGDERDPDREAVRCFHLAKGSLADRRTPIPIACEAGRLNHERFDGFEVECLTIGRMLGNLIKVRRTLTQERHRP
jgi:four helix bundle protein